MSGHMTVQGNKGADEAAKIATETRNIRAYPKQFPSLAHIRK